ncbi:MAG: tRNA lysidine(34) synthetase TilS [Planctomycetota bacterium]|nr:tRNA lysidine(34) synthetase TilS [Planctomycetota bacterium]MDG1983540.1 tRNA lysidine(34) synthetase TilS [Planctomycetota bacterium]
MTGSAKNTQPARTDDTLADEAQARRNEPARELDRGPDGALDRARELDLASGRRSDPAAPAGADERQAPERAPEARPEPLSPAAPAAGPWASRWSRLAHGLGLAPQTPVAVALSGGADSVYLLHILARAESRPKVLAVHVDHRLRGDESHDDAAFCARLCAKLGIPFARRVAEVDPRGGDVEARAREGRYKALASEASAAGISVLLTGHHEDDAVETLLMRWMRGSDLGGLAGLRREAVLGKGHGASKDAPTGMRVLRPLMGMRREEVRSALRREQLEWREDSSNGGSQFSRNRVRNEVLPQIQDSCGEEGVENFFDFAKAIESFEDELADRTGHVQWQAVTHEPARRSAAMPELGGTIPRADLEALSAPLLRRALGRLIGEGTGRRPTRAFLSRLGEAVEEGRTCRMEVHEGWTVQLRSDALHLTPPTESLLPTSSDEPGDSSSAPIAGPGLVLGLPGAVQLADGRSISAETGPLGAPVDPQDPTVIELDGAGITQFRVRFARPGDRFRAPGAPGHKPLRRFLGEAGVPREERGLVPIVLADEEVVWVAGIAVSESRKVTGATDRRIRLSLDGARGGSGR